MSHVTRTRIASLIALIALMVVPTHHSVADPDRRAEGAREDPISASTSGGPSAAAEPAPITLVTGDVVDLESLAGGRQAASITPASRPGGTPEFHKLELGGDLYVIPGDAAPLVAARTLDRELFNVTDLAEEGFDDDSTGNVPLILEYQRGPSASTTARSLPGIRATVSLDSIDSVAVDIRKVRAQSFWRAVTTPNRSRSTIKLEPGLERIWLDAPVEAVLADSVPQIGAPTAWAQGLDGTSVRVAVIDTGINGAHPDLAGKVVGSRGCTPGGATGDGHGHGTHVASIVAGSGAASSGLRRGVAPGTTLLNGKALDNNGFGESSWVIDCMEWAVAQGADVVNMSLGGDPTDGTDPLSQAVDRLTATSGTLFAIAAGNEGRDNFISSPGAATDAITVGAVSKADTLASFSNRGPRRGDFALKPDITGPGVNIIAARAAGTSQGTPVDNNYTTLSGTSMATPHVAGAAAILAQQHPSWSSAQLKAALVSAADPNSQYTVFQQGGGRVDVADAVSQPVYSSPAPLDLGYFPYPHEGDPITKTLRYVNESGSDATLALSLDIRNIETGQAPPAGMVTLSADEVTVPANGEATVSVTLDTRLGDYGLYGGFITAAGKTGPEITTPVGFYKESQRYTLTVDAVAHDGDPAAGRSFVDVLNVDDVEAFNVFSQDFIAGSISLRVPPGTYSVLGAVYTYPGPGTDADPTEVALVGDSEVEVAGDTRVVLDGRTASPADVRVTTHDAVPAADQPRSTLAYMRRDARGIVAGHSLTTPGRWKPHAAPTEPVTVGDFEFYTRQVLVPGASHTGEPFVFDAEFVEPDAIPPMLDYEVRQSELAQDFATVRNAFHANQPGQTYGEFRHHFRPWERGSLQIGRNFSVPTRRTDYISATDSRWQLVVYGQVGTGTPNGRVFMPGTTYSPAQEVTAAWFRQPLRPAFLDGTAGQTPFPTYVQDGNLRLSMQWLGDAQVGHWGGMVWFPGLQRSFRIYQDDELIASGTTPSGDFPVAEGPSRLRIEVDTDSTAGAGDWARLSTNTRTSYTVTTQGGAQEILPLLLVDYDLNLDLLNRTPRPNDVRGPNVFEFSVRHQHGAASPTIDGVRLWVSYDDGATWKKENVFARGPGRFEAILDRRDIDETSGFVSLKVEAWDRDGNRMEQEIVRAGALQARAD